MDETKKETDPIAAMTGDPRCFDTGDNIPANHPRHLADIREALGLGRNASLENVKVAVLRAQERSQKAEAFLKDLLGALGLGWSGVYVAASSLICEAALMKKELTDARTMIESLKRQQAERAGADGPDLAERVQKLETKVSVLTALHEVGRVIEGLKKC